MYNFLRDSLITHQSELSVEIDVFIYSKGRVKEKKKAEQESSSTPHGWPRLLELGQAEAGRIVCVLCKDEGAQGRGPSSAAFQGH